MNNNNEEEVKLVEVKEGEPDKTTKGVPWTAIIVISALVVVAAVAIIMIYAFGGPVK